MNMRTVTARIDETGESDAPWHARSSGDTVRDLRSDVSAGLTTDEASKRLRSDGPNELEPARSTPVWKIFLSQFSSVVVWLLIAAALVALITGNALEAAAIGVVLVINAIFGFAIEWQADRALNALRRSTRATARIRRDGVEKTIDAAELVAGDILVLSAGDRISADARLIEAVNARADESTLTGESVPVEKCADEVERGAPLAERRSMIFLGTILVSGRALAIVTATGKRTELGKIGRLLETTVEKATPLERRLADLGKLLVYIVLIVAVIVMLAGFLRGDDWWLMAEVSISLAVAAVPEGLPAVTTLILALGVLRMARRSAIVRHLAAVETLGSTTVVCTDKTGTLTENRMTVTEIRLADGRCIELTAADENQNLSTDSILKRSLRAAVLCNEAFFQADKGLPVGDPTETALLVAADRLGMDIAAERAAYPKVFEVPFDASSKRMIEVVNFDGRNAAMLKGAPAVVIEACSGIATADGADRPIGEAEKAKLLETNKQMAASSLRVLALADRLAIDPNDDLEHGYTFLGLAGMEDPPREQSMEAIRAAKAAGIRVVMLTGDQVLTAQAIARRLGLSDEEDVLALHSRDLTDADTARLAELARKANVFARVTPEDKLNIVRALQEAGEIVAVTGDGVNDAPALKQADIGIAFGARGTDVAKEAADVVLANDDFSTLVTAIEGGRTIYANIIKFVHLMFSHNLGEILVIFGAIILGLSLPLLPLQILWVNLVTDIFPALALAVEPSTSETMHRPPRSPKESFLSSGFMFLIAWQGVMLAAIVLSAYYWALSSYGEGSHARTIALLSLVSVQLGHLFNCRSRSRSAFASPLSNPYIYAAVAAVAMLQVAAFLVPPVSRVLDLVPPNQKDLGVLLVVFASPILIVELTKAMGRILRRDPDAISGT